MKFRVTVTPLDDEARESLVGHEEDQIECNGFGVLAVRSGDKPDGLWIHQASIDDLAKAMAGNCKYRASARLALAYHDNDRDIQEEKSKESLSSLLSAFLGE